jgi:hypothetical protein
MPFSKNPAQGISNVTCICPIDINKPNKAIYSGHLRLGGSNRQGDTINLTNSYLSWNGRPFFLVSGEFHGSRRHDAHRRARL